MGKAALWGLGAIAVALVLGWLWARRSAGRPSARNDRYAAEALINKSQLQFLQYLQTAFPGQAVLFRAPLGQLVSVRQAADRDRARRRLDEHTVDYVVCDDAGKPAFAFELDAYHGQNTEDAQRDAAEKNRILKSAGVRLVRLKGHAKQLPPPNEFRMKLSLAALPRDDASERRQTRAELEAKLAERDSEFKPSGFKESEVMGLSGLMDLRPGQPDPDDPWKTSRS